MAGRSLTYFVSDVHLGLDVKDPADREARFVAFLRSIPAHQTEALWMLGDIWDFWYEYRDVVPRGYVRVLAALTDLVDAGVKVHLIPGNHDIWCYSYLQSLGIEVTEQPQGTMINGQCFYLGHGDGLGEGMRSYKAMRWMFHNRFLQRAFSCLHPWLAYRLGTGWSKNSRLAKNVEYVFRDADEPLYKYSEEVSRQQKVDHFVYGHFHASVRLTLPSGADFLILKDWMDSSPYAVFDGQSLTVSSFQA